MIQSRSSSNGKIPVAVLGATGSVGQRFVQSAGHPGSTRRSSGVRRRRSFLCEATSGVDADMPEDARQLVVKEGSTLESTVVFRPAGEVAGRSRRVAGGAPSLDLRRTHEPES